MVEVAVIGTPCVARVEQSIGCCLRAALSCRALALEQLDVVAVALQRHGLADENVAAPLGCRLRLGQRYRAAVGELEPCLVVATGPGHRAGACAGVGTRRAGCCGGRRGTRWRSRGPA